MISHPFRCETCEYKPDRGICHDRCPFTHGDTNHDFDSDTIFLATEISGCASHSGAQRQAPAPKHGDCPDCPILTGDDAKRFHDYINDNNRQESPETKEMIRRANELAKTLCWDPKKRAEHDAQAAAAERERVFSIVRNVINTDASGLAAALNKIKTLAKGYDWIPDGEWGSYDYTQRNVGTLQKEVGYLLEEIEKISYEGLRDSGNRVIEHIKKTEESLRSQPERQQEGERK